MTTSQKQGFTLIELSIVLVIIGLIVGGILTGSALIDSAKIRATVAQIEKYNTAVNAFRGKYNGMPGDMQSPASFFNATITDYSATTTGKGNGNGIIEPVTTAKADGEMQVFWQQLAYANLIAEPISYSTMDFSDQATNASAANPPSKMGKGLYITVTTPASGAIGVGLNYFQLTTLTGTVETATQTASALTPVEAFQIDTKLDDSKPGAGTVVSIVSGGTSVLNLPATPDRGLSSYCTTGTGTTDTYAVGSTNANTASCSLGMRASF